MILLELENSSLPTARPRRRTVSPPDLALSSAGDRIAPNSPFPSSPVDEFSPSLPPADIKSLTDEELVKFCQQNLSKNLKCFEEIVSRYRSYIYGYSLRRLQNPDDAEECSQDIFIRLHKKISQFKGLSSFKTWLFHIARNVCNSKIGSLATRRTKGEQYDQELSVQFDALVTDAGTDDLAEKMQQALEGLDEKKRAIIKLRFIFGFQIDEIAKILDLKSSATKMRLYRALEEVKESYLRASRQEATA